MNSITLRLVFYLIISVLFASCQSSMIRAFDSVAPGMDKHQVLEIVGSPSTTLRMKGKDRWLYRFYEDSIRFDKEIQFADGFVIYVGETWTPPPGQRAEDKDKRAAQEELKDQAAAAQRNKSRAKIPADLEAFENKVKLRDDIHYLPDFETLD